MYMQEHAPLKEINGFCRSPLTGSLDSSGKSTQRGITQPLPHVPFSPPHHQVESARLSPAEVVCCLRESSNKDSLHQLSSTLICLTSCLGNTPAYRCDYMEQLQAKANITNPVTHVNEKTSPPSPPPQDTQTQFVSVSDKSCWENLEKIELISLVEKLIEEASQSNIISKTLWEERDLVIENI